MKFKKWIQKENPLIFEIGSNDGADTLGFFEEFLSPIVHCFEPDPNVFSVLKTNISNKEDISCILNNVAISNYEGTAEFYNASNTYSGSIKVPKEHVRVRPDIVFKNEYKVKTIRLDDYIKKYSIQYCDLVYMDVQGAEDLVFAGGEYFFNECVKYIFTEYSNIELYENAPTKERILELLPNFELVETFNEYYSGDILLINKKFKNEQI